jgi:hypothetical protein
VTVGYSILALPALYLNYYLRDSTPGWVSVVYGLGPLLPIVRSRPELRGLFRGRRPRTPQQHHRHGEHQDQRRQ